MIRRSLIPFFAASSGWQRGRKTLNFPPLRYALTTPRRPRLTTGRSACDVLNRGVGRGRIFDDVECLAMRRVIARTFGLLPIPTLA